MESRRYQLLGLCFLVMLIAFSSNAQTIRYVHAGATGANNGSSWANAFTSLQAALDVSLNGDQIWIAKGTYKPIKDINGNANPTNLRTKVFLLRDGVSLYGGFSGTETSLSQRNVQANPTILSGDLQGNDALNFVNNEENSYHVVAANALTSPIQINGLTISGGNANAALPFLGNEVGNLSGGGLYAANFVNKLTVSNCVFSGNKSDYGGGIFLFDSSPKVVSCVITGNAAMEGGGIFCAAGSAPDLLNMLIANNMATRGAGIFKSGNSTVEIINCSIIGNQATDKGGALYVNSNYSPVIKNSIIWNNTSPQAPTIYSHQNSTFQVSYSNIQGGYAGLGNKNGDPLFFDNSDLDGADNIFRTRDDGLHLLLGSPSAGTAYNGYLYTWGITTDLTGAARNLNEGGGGVDMGAYKTLSECASPLVPAVTQQCGMALLTTVAPPAGYTYYWQNTAEGTEITNSALTYSVTTSGTYYLRSRNNATGCWSAPTAVFVAITPPPPLPVIVSSGGENTCNGDLPISYTLANYTGTILRWETLSTGDGGATTWNTLATTSSNVISSSFSVTTTLRVVISNSCGTYYSQPFTSTVHPAPAAPPSPTITQNCSIVSLATVPAMPGFSYYWQESSQATGTDHNELVYTVASSGTYYLRARNNTSGCWSSATSVVVTLSTASVTGQNRVCSNTPFTLTLSSDHTGTILRWESSTNGGQTWNAIANTSATLNSTGINVTTLYRTVLGEAHYTCPYTVEALSLPVMPEAPVFNEQCGSTIATTSSPVPGVTYHWVNPISSQGVSGLSYTANQLENLNLFSKNADQCISPIRSVVIPVTNMSSAPPAPTINNGCGRVVLEYGNYPQFNYSYYWQSSPTGTSTSSYGGSWPGKYTITTPGIYYLRARSNNSLECWSPATPVIVNIINQEVTAPSVTSVERCGPGSFTLYAYGCSETYRWYSQPSGGIPIGTSHSILTPQLTTTTTYYVCNVSSSGIEGPRSALTVTINPIPAKPAPLSIAQQCDGSTLLSISEEIPSNITYFWQGENPNGETTTNSSPTYSTQSMLTIISVRARNNVTGCWSESRGASIEINYVPPVPLPPTAGTQHCHTVEILPTEPVIAPFYRYYWQSEENGTDMSKPAVTLATGVIPLPVTESGTYYIRSVNDIGCWSASSAVSVTLEPSMNCFEGQDMNYIVSNTILASGIRNEADILSLPVESNSQSIIYFDGLNRPIQRVETFASPTRQDLVQIIAYDQLGREAKGYLPFTDGSNGRYKQQAESGQLLFYQNPSNAVTNFPFGEKVFENSPLGKLKEQSSPGEAWRLGGGHTLKTSERFNTLNEVRLWNFDFNTRQSTSGAHYAPQELLVAETTNEDGHKTWRYIDKQGREILNKKEVSPGKFAETYMIYDAIGNLRMVMQPEGVKEMLEKPEPWITDDVFIDKWCFTYEYDAWGRVSKKKVPGKYEEYIVYNKLGLPILTQDGKMRDENQWKYTKYDGLGRVLFTGVFTDGEGRNQTLMQADADSHTGLQYEQTSSFNSNVQQGYTWTQSFPILTSSNSLLHTVNYYDDYDYNNDGLVDKEVLPEEFIQPPAFQTEVRGKLTGTRVSSTKMLLTGIFYDTWNNIVQTQQENHLDGEDITSHRFDFSGKLLESKLKHLIGGATPTYVSKWYTYDHAGRPLKVKHQVNNHPIVTLSSSEYNELGQQVVKKLHSLDDETFKQKVDYQYNVRGWLSMINDPNLSGEPDDLFGMGLGYDDVVLGLPATPSYSANISSIVYNHRGGDLLKAYTFKYDSISRLRSASYMASLAAGWNQQVGGFNEGISYDLNGNITELDRYAYTSALQRQQIDHLTYTYDGNKMRSIEDGTMNTLGFVNGVSDPEEYFYDVNGNIVGDANKGIDLTYNHQNLVTNVLAQGGDGGEMYYDYDALGGRLNRTVFRPGVSGSDSRYYVSGFEYNNSKVLEFFPTEEGRVVMNSGTPEYQYYMKDHLGNIRMTFTTKNESDEAIATLEEAKKLSEQDQFSRFHMARRIYSSLFDRSNGASPGYAQRLNGSANEKYGLAKSMSVMPGDTVKLEVYAKFLDRDRSNWTQALTQLVQAVATGTADPGTIVDGIGYNSSTSSFFFGGLQNTSSSTSNGPKAFLNWLVFDRNFILLDAGYQKMSEVANERGEDVAHEALASELVISEPGYVYTYLSNEEASPLEVYFDDFKVEKINSAIVDVSEYYPYGETFNSHQREGVDRVDQKYLLTGKEKQTDLGLGWYDFGARMYDAILGRWNAVDQLADKYPSWGPYNYVLGNPINSFDPDGNAALMVVDYSVGQMSSLTISSTIHATGNINQQRIDHINEYAKNYFKQYTRDGVSVTFNVKFVLDQSITQATLPAGDNIMDFHVGDGRANVVGHIDANNIEHSGNVASEFHNPIKDSEAAVAVHETFHMLGLSDRYVDGFGPFEHFENDIMGTTSAGAQLGDTHIKSLISRASEMFPDNNDSFLPQRGINTQMVDRDKRRNLTPATPKQIEQNADARERKQERLIKVAPKR
jgi:RHS repeat-associated protein